MALAADEISRIDIDYAVDAREAARDALRGGDARANAKALRSLLEGKSDNAVYFATVQLNAAAAFVVAGIVSDLRDGMALARDTVQSGHALKALDRVVELTSAAP